MWWHEPTAHTPDGEGFWSVATYAEVLHVLSTPLDYSSETGGDRPYGGTLIQDLPVSGVVLNMMDDPRQRADPAAREQGAHADDGARPGRRAPRRAGALLDAVPDAEPIDFLVDVAAELPMQMICILLGVPESDRHDLFAAIEPGFDFRTGNGTEREPSTFDMLAYGRALIAEKRATPGDDMLSVVGRADGSMTSNRRGSPMTSSTCSSACSSRPGARPPATRSPAAWAR